MDQNPENGGTPAIASQPMTKVSDGDRQVLAQAAVTTHVLLVRHGVDHRTGSQEQQRLEEGVGDHVEHARHERPGADGEEHVAELGDGRVREHLLDVVLRHRGEGGDERGEQRRPRAITSLAHPDSSDQRVEAGEQEDARGDHGRRVDQRGDRRGAGHGVGQPHEQRQLRRLAGGGEEEQQHDRGRGDRRDALASRRSTISR